MVFQDFLCIGPGGINAVDGIDLGKSLMVPIRDDTVLGFRFSNANWFGLPLEKIDRRRAAELKGIGVHTALEDRQSFPSPKLTQQDDQLHPIGPAGTRREIEAMNVKKQELLGKAEKLLKQPVTEKTAVVVWKQAFVVAETDFSQAILGQRHRTTSLRTAHDDLKGVVQNQLMKRIGDLTITIQIETQVRN